MDGNIIGMKFERTGEIDWFGLNLGRIEDEEVAARLAELQAEKAELMEQYNSLLAQAADADDAGDTEAGAQFDKEAEAVY